jgi:tetratricopeptide (TPR) repeat protein
VKFDNSLALFQHLLSIDEDKMLENLSSYKNENSEFIREVSDLIRAHVKNQENTGFKALISEQAASLVEDEHILEFEGIQVGVYKLTKKLGLGGMGAVYLGVRNDGQLQQNVAVKFVYPSIVAFAGENFLQKEAQHLANLDHINIAKIYTIELTESGMPYMVMEYVDGVPIDQYCAHNHLGLNAKLNLCQTVCHAVQTAHQNMIIHADIKPSNILIDKQNEPKLMDFGIAKTLNQNSVSASIKNDNIKAFSHGYSSPEQLEGEALTTACDVYSLGKLLSIILSQEEKNTELQQLIEKCSATNLKERLADVNELSIEIQKFLDNKPLSIIGYSKGTLLKKSFQRNKSVYAGTFGFIAFLSIFIGVLSVKNYELEWENNKNTKLLIFLKELISAADVENNMPRDFSVKDLIIQGGRKVDAKFKGYEEQSLIIKNVLSRGLINLGFYEEADALINDIDESRLKDNDLLEMLLNKATAKHGVSKFNEAYEYYLEIEKRLDLINDFQNVIWLKTAPLMAGVLSDLGKSDEALEKITKLDNLDYFEKAFPFDVAEAYRMSAQIYFRANDIDNAKVNLNAAFAIVDKFPDREHMFMIGINNTAGNLFFKADELDNAKEKYQAAYDHSIKLLGKEHPLTAFSLRNLSTVLEMSGEFDLAIKGYEEVKDIFYALNGEKSINVALILSDLGIVSQKKRDYDNALKYFSDSLELYKEVLGNKNRDVANLTTKVADIYYLKDEFETAISLYELGIDNYSSLPGKFKNHVSIHTSSLAKCYGKLGKYELFEVEIQKALMLLEDEEISERTKKRVIAAFDEFKKEA